MIKDEDRLESYEASNFHLFTLHELEYDFQDKTLDLILCNHKMDLNSLSYLPVNSFSIPKKMSSKLLQLHLAALEIQ